MYRLICQHNEIVFFIKIGNFKCHIGKKAKKNLDVKMLNYYPVTWITGKLFPKSLYISTFSNIIQLPLLS